MLAARWHHRFTLTWFISLISFSKLTKAQSQLDENKIEQGAFGPAQHKDYVFSVVHPNTLFQITVSPCRNPAGLSWRLTHEGDTLYENELSDQNLPTTEVGRQPKGSTRLHTPNGWEVRPSHVNSPTGLGEIIRSYSVIYELQDADTGRYAVELNNIGQKDVEFSVMLTSPGKLSNVPVLPELNNVRVDRIRPMTMYLSWPAAQSQGRIEYCAFAIQTSKLRSGDVVDSACGLQQIISRLGAASSSRVCTGKMEVEITNLRPDTSYHINVIAQDTESQFEMAYAGVAASTTRRGTPLSDGQEKRDVNLLPQSERTFSFDLTERFLSPVALNNPLSVTIFPCSGQIMWTMSVDGIHLQQFIPAALSGGAGASGASMSADDSDSASMSSSTGDRQGRSLDKHHPLSSFPIYLQPYAQPDQADVPDVPDTTDQPDLPDVADLPSNAGLGQSAGQTVFTFHDEVPRAGLYQLTVFNVGHERATFNIFPSTNPANQPFANLPPDPQVKITQVSHDSTDVMWYPGYSSDPLAYCVVATKKRKLSTNFVQSSACGLQSGISEPPAVGGDLPIPGQGSLPGYHPLDGTAWPDLPTELQIHPTASLNDLLSSGGATPTEHIAAVRLNQSPEHKEKNMLITDIPAPIIYLSKGQCTNSNHHHLTNLSHDTQYNIEVLAVNQRTGRARSYTSALVRTSGATMGTISGAAFSSGIGCLLMACLATRFGFSLSISTDLSL